MRRADSDLTGMALVRALRTAAGRLNVTFVADADEKGAVIILSKVDCTP